MTERAEVFSRIFTDNLWLGAVPSGPGSTLQATAIIRDELPRLFATLGILSLVDAACGDITWIPTIAGHLDRYAGFDIVRENIEQIKRKGPPSKFSFGVADITTDVLPKADAILCRDCLVHLPLADAQNALRKFAESGSTYLIATTFPTRTENKDIKVGSWRPLNLQLPPFNLPKPVALIRERAPHPDDPYNDKCLGVWRLTKPAIRTTFFTVSDGNYGKFALPYAGSILVNNPDAAVEIVVNDRRAINPDGVAYISEAFGEDRFKLRDYEFPDYDAATLRFLLEPETLSEYVYIGDIDFLILDSGITDTHIKNAARFDLPYSNVVRPNSKRLTGLHFTRRDAYYPVPTLPPSVLKSIDEEVLFEIVRRKGLRFPTGGFRPGHGLHLSHNRTQIIDGNGVPSWGLNADTWTKYKRFKLDPRWQALIPYLHPDYVSMLHRLETAGAEKWG